MKIYRELEQRSDEWFQVRKGLITASAFDKILTPTGKLSAQAQGVVNQCIADSLTENIEESFCSAAMERGKELEDEAHSFIKLVTNIDFKNVGFVDSELGYGCSPDGLNEEIEMGLELKCPLANTHVSYLRANKLPSKYLPQVQGSMLVTGYKKWTFCSYCPEIKSLIIEVERDDEYCNNLHEALLKLTQQIREGVKSFSL